MRPIRVRLAVVTASVVLLGTATATTMGSGVPASVQYIAQDKVKQVMAKGGPIVNDPGLIVLAQRREAGPAEYHDKTNHVFIMEEGEATLIVGGTPVDAKRTAADQMRAPSTNGGTTYHMKHGDVITIPAKTWHWFKEVPSKTVAYYAVNIDSE
jgi:mannose-6-phosphate isomerase-like protein (cupin superfamily)